MSDARDRVVMAALDGIYGEAALLEPSAMQLSVAEQVAHRVVGEYEVLRLAGAVGGVWVVYYGDGSMVMAFGSEIDALREAVDSNAKVKFLKWGEIL